MNGTFSSEESDEAPHAFSTSVEQDRLLKNSNIFKQGNEHSNFGQCPKHPSKKAKYYVQMDRRTMFCSKCALNLALRGLKIHEDQQTNGSNLELQRQQRITQFQDSLKVVADMCQNKLIQIEDTVQMSIKEQNEQRDNCLLFFEQVVNTANQLRQTYVSKFQNDHQMLMGGVHDSKDSVHQLEQQLKQFQFDIEKNHDNIVKHMDMKPFDDIMTRYERKVLATKQQLAEISLQLLPKQTQFETSQILTYMNKMCYNLLLKTDQEPGNKRQSNKQSVSSNNGNPSSIDLKLFDMLEGEDIYQSTCSNPVKDGGIIPTQSPIRQVMRVGQTNSNPISTLQNSRRESNANTPESWQQKNMLMKSQKNNTPNVERDSHPPQQSSFIQRYAYRTDKQKTSNLVEQPIIENLSCIKDSTPKSEWNEDRQDRQDRQLTPKHQKSLTQQPQVFKLNSNTNHSSQKSQFQYPSNCLLEQPQQKDIKSNYESVPNDMKSVTPHHTLSQELLKQLMPEQRNNGRTQQQQQQQDRRSNSKFGKQQSIDQNDGKRQFIMNNIAQYTTQPANEESLKDRIFKELCQHPNDSVYNQVLKLNNQSKQQIQTKNQQGRYLNKENEWSSSTLRKNNTYLCIKKQ